MRRKATDKQIIAAYRKVGSMRAVRNELGVARRTVRSCLGRAQIAYRPRYVKPATVKQIVLIYKEIESMQEAVRRTGACQATVRKYLLRAGINLKTISKRGRRAGTILPLKIKTTDAELARLYKVTRSAPKIATMFGCSAVAVTNRLHKAGIQVLPRGGDTRFKVGQPSPRRIAFDMDEMVRLYHKHKSTHRVAEALRCSQGAVYHALRRAGQSFVYKGHRPPVWNKARLDVKKVIQTYKKLGSATRTAKAFGVTKATILRILRKMDIPYPNRGRIKKGHVPWNKGLRGPRNSNWKHGFSALNESMRSLPEYRRWRQAVLEKDGYQCQSCGKTTRLEAHHKGKGFTALLKKHRITARAQAAQCRALWQVVRGTTLCHRCHSKTDTYKAGYRRSYVA